MFSVRCFAHGANAAEICLRTIILSYTVCTAMMVKKLACLMQAQARWGQALLIHVKHGHGLHDDVTHAIPGQV